MHFQTNARAQENTVVAPCLCLHFDRLLQSVARSCKLHRSLPCLLSVELLVPLPTVTTLCLHVGTSSLILPGTHITPCGSDVDWQVGRSFSPLDAVALGVKAVVQADIRRLGDKLIGWLESHS